MKRILLAYDGAEPARKALATAADLAKKFEATITVVSVVPVHPGRTPIDPWDDPAVHSAQLKEAAAPFASSASRRSSWSRPATPRPPSSASPAKASSTSSSSAPAA